MKLYAVLFIAAAICMAGCQGRRSSEESQNSWEQEATDILAAVTRSSGSRSISHSNWNEYTSEFPQAAPYQRKIQERLQNSESLANKSKIQEKIFDIALDKLSKCKSLSSNQNRLDKTCVGRCTGQMMQLIATVEKLNRNVAGNNW